MESAMDQDNGFGRPAGQGRELVRVLGHRGAPGPGRPDNSVAAVTEALHQGADGVEVDVQLTPEGMLVCAHDPIGLLDDDAQAALATLVEVLAVARWSGCAQVVVEAKPVTGPVAVVRTARALADVLRAGAGSAAITVSSFDADLLAVIRRACADLRVRTALLGERTTPVGDVVRRAAADGHDEVHLPLAGVRRTPEVVATAHALGLTVALWTVNQRAALQWAAELGAYAVITDDVLTAWSELDRIPAPALAAA
jgi:glycerophosphoryl diester phosphodiesterase